MKKMAVGIGLSLALSGCAQEPPERGSLPAVEQILPELSGESLLVYTASTIEELQLLVDQDIDGQRPIGVSFNSEYLQWVGNPEDAEGDGAIIVISNPLILIAKVEGQELLLTGGVAYDPDVCEDQNLVLFYAGTDSLAIWDRDQEILKQEVLTRSQQASDAVLVAPDKSVVGHIEMLPGVYSQAEYIQLIESGISERSITARTSLTADC